MVAVYLGALSYVAQPARAGYVSQRAILTGYDSSGVITGTVKLIVRTTTSTTGGQWTIDYTNAGLNSALACIPEIVGSDSTANGAGWATPVTMTTTSCSGTVTKPAIVVLASLAISLGTTVSTVQAIIFGQ